MTSQLTVSERGCLRWSTHCHLVDVGVGSVSGSIGEHQVTEWFNVMTKRTFGGEKTEGGGGQFESLA